MAEVYFQNLTRGQEIGANSYLLEDGRSRILLDSGMHPKGKGYDALPDFDLIGPWDLDLAVITHGHLDHIGSLPVLMRRQPGLRAVMTPLTAEITEAMLHNSCNVMTSQRDQEGIREYPLFTHREVDGMLRRWLHQRPGRSFEIRETGVRAEFFDAGHLPGSIGVQLDYGDLRVFYTGDVHFEPQTLSTAAAFPETGIDVLIMEATRGAVPRDPGYTRQRESWRFAEAVMRTIGRGGSVLLPVFALGKTQEILIMIHDLKRTGHLSRDIPVHIGGLSTRMTQIIDRHCEDVPRTHRGFRILESMDGLIRAKKGERLTTASPGRIYALSSGMMSEYTASNDFAYNFIDNPKNSVIFVGYADPDSPGGHLRKAAAGDPVKLHHAYPPVTLRAEVEAFDFSGHATRDELVEYAKRVRPRKLLLVHGDAPAMAWMVPALQAALPETEVLVPQPGERIRLDG